MNSYTPQVGHKVLVDFEDLGLHVATIDGVSEYRYWILLFKGEPGEQHVGIDDNGNWSCRESGQRVYLLDPYATPERGGLGFVIPEEGPVEEWYMGYTGDPGWAEGFLHTEQVVGTAHIQDDGTWIMNETDQVFFISKKQAEHRTGEKVAFSSGLPNDLALAATRLTTLHQLLRNKYFYYAEMGRPADSMTAATAAMAIRDEYAEMLFLAETGLRYDQAVEKFEEFTEALHEEFLASQEG